MLTTRKSLLNLVAAAALGSLASGAFAVEIADKQEAMKLKNLAKLEETASTSAEFERIARLYELRAEMLDDKVDRHQRLEKRYAAAPASLLAKRGTGWNTPKRQRQLARTASKQAAEAREMASAYLAKADAAFTAAD